MIAFLQFKRLRDDQYEIESNQGKAHPNIWVSLFLRGEGRYFIELFFLNLLLLFF